MNTKEQKFNVVNGPSRDRLIDAFKYAYSDRAQIPIDFEVASIPSGNGRPTVLKVKDFRIIGLQHEDGSGWSFNIEGYCKVNHRPFCWFTMYYNTKKHKGTVTFKED